ncbi:hypothetical protein A3Q56_08666, partial [Intoshia linei]
VIKPSEKHVFVKVINKKKISQNHT